MSKVRPSATEHDKVVLEFTLVADDTRAPPAGKAREAGGLTSKPLASKAGKSVEMDSPARKSLGIQ